MSYFAFLDAWGMFTERGAIISQEVWEKSFFVLPFRLSFEVSNVIHEAYTWRHQSHAFGQGQ